MEPNGAEWSRGHSGRAAPTWVEEELSDTIIGCFFWVYNKIGFGFLESVYAKALEVALKLTGLKVDREVPVTIFFEGVDVGQHRMDMVVEDRIVLEIRATEKLSDVAKRQLRNYLSAMDLELGILLHFGPTADHHRVLIRKKGPIDH